jgi:glycosyltransferase involved in cell wall biosynthesis
MTEPVVCAITVEPEAWILRTIVEQCCRHATRVRFEPVDAYQAIPPHFPVVFYSTWCHYYAQPKERRHIPMVALMTHFDYLAWRVVAMTWGRPGLVLCMSDLYRRRLRIQGVPARKLQLAPLGVDLDLFTPEPPEAESGKITIGLVGRIYPDGHKGEHLIREIARQLDPDRFSLCIVGSHWEPWLESMRDSALEIAYHRMVETADLPRLYRRMDALLIASKREGGPVTALEALACGVPVISRPVGYVPDLIRVLPWGGALFDSKQGAIAALQKARQLKTGLGPRREETQKELENYAWRSFARHAEEAVLRISELRL